MFICFGSVPFSPLYMLGSSPSLPPFWPETRLSAAGDRRPWVDSLGQLAARSLEQCLGSYPAADSELGTPPDFWDAEDLALGMDDHPCVWTGGSRE